MSHFIYRFAEGLCAECHYAECGYTECPYDERRGALLDCVLAEKVIGKK